MLLNLENKLHKLKSLRYLLAGRCGPHAAQDILQLKEVLSEAEHLHGEPVCVGVPYRRHAHH